MGPWEIIPLPEEPSLCPVACLKSYLQSTSHWTTGQLFRAETGKPLSPKDISGKVGYFVKRADPEGHFLGHDPRKVATSLNFWSHMSFEALQGYTGWKSPRVFFKHYFKKIEEIKRSLVAAGRVVQPR